MFSCATILTNDLSEYNSTYDETMIDHQFKNVKNGVRLKYSNKNLTSTGRDKLKRVI